MLVQSISVFSLAVFLLALLPEIKWMMMMMIIIFGTLSFPITVLPASRPNSIPNALFVAVFARHVKENKICECVPIFRFPFLVNPENHAAPLPAAELKVVIIMTDRRLQLGHKEIIDELSRSRWPQRWLS